MTDFMKMIRRIIVVGLCGIIVCAGGLCYHKVQNASSETIQEETPVSYTAISSYIEDVAELVTDEYHYKVYDKKNSIFNPLTIEDANLSYSDMLDSSEQSAIENGLLDKSNENAQKLMQEFLTDAFDLSGYIIVFN